MSEWQDEPEPDFETHRRLAVKVIRLVGRHCDDDVRLSMAVIGFVVTHLVCCCRREDQDQVVEYFCSTLREAVASEQNEGVH